MFQRFLSLVDADPGAVALIDGESGKVTTRAELRARAEELMVRLVRDGIREGDALAIQLPNSVDFVIAVLAALGRGLVAIPIDRDAPEVEVASILGHFSVRGLVYQSDRHARDRTPSISIREISERPAVPSVARLIKLTSGSTGMPKGIVTTEANLIADCTNICASMGITPDDVNLGAIPFSHSYGFSNLVTPLILQGTPIVVSNDYLPQSLIDMANRHRCTVAPLIPMVFDTPHCRRHMGRSRAFARSSPPARRSRRRRRGDSASVSAGDIHSFYGCSECGGITYDRRGAAVERGSVGAALENVELATRGERLAPVRSGSVAAGI